MTTSLYFTSLLDIMSDVLFLLSFLNTCVRTLAEPLTQCTPVVNLRFLLSVFVAGRASGLGRGRGKKRSGAAGEGQGIFLTNSLFRQVALNDTVASQTGNTDIRRSD